LPGQKSGKRKAESGNAANPAFQSTLCSSAGDSLQGQGTSSDIRNRPYEFENRNPQFKWPDNDIVDKRGGRVGFPLSAFRFPLSDPCN
jgi:hypothetical protein